MGSGCWSSRYATVLCAPSMPRCAHVPRAHMLCGPGWQKDELKEFLGAADGTLLFKMLQEYKAAPSASVAPPPPPPPPPVAVTSSAAPAPGGAAGGAGYEAFAGSGSGNPIEESPGAGYQAFGAAKQASPPPPPPLPPSRASPHGSPPPQMSPGAGSEALSSSSLWRGQVDSASGASLNSRAEDSRQSTHTEPKSRGSIPGFGSGSSMPASPALGGRNSSSSSRGGRSSAAAASLDAHATAAGGGDGHGDMDSQEEVRRAALSAGVPVVRPQELELGRRVGAGSYGNVFAGVWRGTDVAVKMLKASLGAQDLRDAHEDVIKELRTMRRVGNHKNVVSLLGVCMLENPMRLCIVTDLMSRGSLLDVLKKGKLAGTSDHPLCMWCP